MRVRQPVRRLGVFMMILTALEARANVWRPLFNGKDLTGWKQVGEGHFEVKDGLMCSRGGMGLLYWAGGKVKDVELRLVYRTVNAHDNSGVFIRIPLEPREAWMPVHYGYEIQIDDNPERWNEDDHHYTGAIYSFSRVKTRAAKPGGEWNTLDIRLKGDRTQVDVNGRNVTDFKEGESNYPMQKDAPQRGPRPIEGYFGLQNHSEADVVCFKEVLLRPLKTTDKK